MEIILYLVLMSLLNSFIFSFFMYRFAYKKGKEEGISEGKVIGFKKGLYLNFKVENEVLIQSYVDDINSRIN